MHTYSYSHNHHSNDTTRSTHLVAARPEDETLHVCLARGTGIWEAHEARLVQLCTRGETNSNSNGSTGSIMSRDPDDDRIIQTYLQQGYDWNSVDDDIDDDTVPNIWMEDSNGINGIHDNGDDGEATLQSMYQMWADDSEYTPATANGNASPFLPNNTPSVNGSNNSNGKVVKPWSSRSSPSGTWVRDPATGQLRNIDA
jgi:hypothetical protein